MKFKVEKYNEHWEEPRFVHICKNEDGIQQCIDLMVNGDFDKGFDPKELVGKTVEVKRIHSYIAIAHDVKIVEERL